MFKGEDRWSDMDDNYVDQAKSWKGGRVQWTKLEDTTTSLCKDGSRFSPMTVSSH